MSALRSAAAHGLACGGRTSRPAHAGFPGDPFSSEAWNAPAPARGLPAEPGDGPVGRCRPHMPGRTVATSVAGAADQVTGSRQGSRAAPQSP